MAGTTNLDEYYIAPFYKTTFEWRQEETEHMLLKASNGRLVDGLVDGANGFWIKVEAYWYLNRLIFENDLMCIFIDFRYSVRADTHLNYSLNIQQI
ncbi:hypothetical protein V1477_021197 [Vespula maculifrons]|uniref:Uncharacterized protein n=1 Tax=Vespula maculifrons TaxID=7453 RepID=A0ABD2AGG2_VESMC